MKKYIIIPGAEQEIRVILARPVLIDCILIGRQPARRYVVFPVPQSVGFYVEHGSPFYHIHIRNNEPVSFPDEKPDNGQPQGVGAVGAACGEDTALFVVEWGAGGQMAPPGLMEMEQDIQVGESVYIGQPRFIVLDYLNFALDVSKTVRADVSLPLDILGIQKR